MDWPRGLPSCRKEAWPAISLFFMFVWEALWTRTAGEDAIPPIILQHTSAIWAGKGSDPAPSSPWKLFQSTAGLWLVVQSCLPLCCWGWALAAWALQRLMHVLFGQSTSFQTAVCEIEIECVAFMLCVQIQDSRGCKPCQTSSVGFYSHRWHPPLFKCCTLADHICDFTILN